LILIEVDYISSKKSLIEESATGEMDWETGGLEEEVLLGTRRWRRRRRRAVRLGGWWGWK
jgi:hypothetical protein